MTSYYILSAYLVDDEVKFRLRPTETKKYLKMKKGERIITKFGNNTILATKPIISKWDKVLVPIYLRLHEPYPEYDLWADIITSNLGDLGLDRNTMSNQVIDELRLRFMKTLPIHKIIKLYDKPLDDYFVTFVQKEM